MAKSIAALLLLYNLRRQSFRHIAERFNQWTLRTDYAEQCPRLCMVLHFIYARIQARSAAAHLRIVFFNSTCHIQPQQCWLGSCRQWRP